MYAVVIRTNGEITVEDLKEPLHKATRPILGGLIEVVRPYLLPHPYRMLVNESALLLELPINLIGSYLYGSAFHGNPIVGNIIIMKEAVINEWGEHDIVGLEEQEAHNICNYFKEIYVRLTEEDEEEEAI